MTHPALTFFLLNHQTTSIDVQFNIYDNTSTSDNPSCPDHTPNHKIPNQPSRPIQRDEPTDFKVQPGSRPASFPNQSPRGLPKPFMSTGRPASCKGRAPGAHEIKKRRTACRGDPVGKLGPPPLRSSFRLRYAPPPEYCAYLSGRASRDKPPLRLFDKMPPELVEHQSLATFVLS